MPLFRALPLFFVSCVASDLPPSVCGPVSPSPVVDCDHSDLGSCGNACCTLEVSADLAPEDAYSRIYSALNSSVDGQYRYSTGGYPVNPGDDLRQYNIAYQFILQGRHDCPNFYGENGDVFDISISKATAEDGTIASTLRMFSLSFIHGALGDNGQNYKTLTYFLQNVFEGTGVNYGTTIVHGCGSATKRV